MVLSYFSSLGTSLKNGVTTLDMFSNKVVFTYNGKSNFKTMIGGCYSIIMFSIVLSYAYILGTMMISRKRSNSSISTQVVDLASEPKRHYPGLNGFSFTYVVSDDYGKIYELDESFYTVTWSQIAITRNYLGVTSTNITVLDMKICDVEDLSFKTSHISSVIKMLTFTDQSKKTTQSQAITLLTLYHT